MEKTKKVIGDWWLVVSGWVKKNPKEALLLALILLVGAFLRFYRLPEYMTFLGDEGRDAIIVRRFIVNFDLMLIGPQTSIGNMYLGPLYYYMMAPALALFGLSPVGPAAQIALLGVITIFFIWFIGREWFPPKASHLGGQVAWGALSAATIYAVSPVVITYSQSSWNPNIMPLFALLSIYAIWRVWKYHQWRWLIVLGAAYAFVLQSHYLGLLLAPTLGLFWLLTFYVIRKTQDVKRFLKYSVISVFLFAFLMSPLVIFDARHGWRNFESMKVFFTERQTTVSARPWNAIPQLWPLTEQVSARLLAGKNQALGGWVGAALVLGTAWLTIIQRRNISKAWPFGLVKSPLLLLLSWIGFGLVGLGVYKQQIYDHYFGFMFAAPFLLAGALIQQIATSKQQIVKILLFAGLAVLVWLNLAQTPIRYSPNRQLQRTEEVAAKIAEEAGGKPLNLAVIAERNYEDAYQYFLEWWRELVRDIDPLRLNETLAEQLFVVCEVPREKCDPTHSPKTEIANFGWSKIEEEWELAGVHLFKLVHTQ